MRQTLVGATGFPVRWVPPAARCCRLHAAAHVALVDAVDVTAGATHDHVVAADVVPAAQQVRPAATEPPVTARAAVQVVRAHAAQQDIAPAMPAEDVCARPTPSSRSSEVATPDGIAFEEHGQIQRCESRFTGNE